MSFFGTTGVDPNPTQKKKRHGNITEDQLNTNQQVTPVTYFAGRRYIAGQFLSPCYNQVTKDIQGQTGKDEEGTVAHVYFADFGLLFGMGGRHPVDGAFKLIIDSEIFWRNDSGLMRDTPAYVDVTIKRGTFRLYWGLSNSPQDTLVFTTRGAVPIDPSFNPRDKSTWPPDNSAGNDDPLSGHYDQHPAYRNQCYAVFKKWRLGKEKEQVPQIMMELQRGVPWFAGSSADRATNGLDSDARGVNPIGVLYDWLTDPIFGMGLADTDLYQPGFEAALAAFANFRISPLVTDQDDAKNVIVKLLEYIDGFVRWRDGLLDVGWFGHGNIDQTQLPLLTDDDLDDVPDIPPGSFVDSDTTFYVSYSDGAHHYNDRPQKFDDPSIRRVVKDKRINLLDRPWLTDMTLAKQFVTEFGTMQRAPKQDGDVFVKREWLDNAPKVGGGSYGVVREGDRFKFQSAKYGFQTVFRINEIEWPEDKSGQVKLAVENERALWTSLYVPPPDPGLSDFVIEPTAITNRRVIELPSGLKTLAVPQIAILAQRPRLEAIAFAVYASVDNTTFDLVYPNNPFSMFGKVAGSPYPNSTADLDTTTGITVDLFGADLDRVVAQTDQQRDDNTLLLFVDNEIMSVGTVTALGSGRYNIKVRRALYGTTKANHVLDANVWFAFRNELTPIDNKNFVPGTTRYFKLQPYTSLEPLDLASITSFSYNFISAPAVGSVTLTSLVSVAGVAADNSPDIRIVAKWDAPLDQDIFLFEIAWKKTADTNWQSKTVGADSSGHNVFDFEATPSTPYLVKIRAINSYGEPGPYIADQAINSATLTPFTVTGLELVGQGNDTICTQPDFPFGWRLNSPSTTISGGALVPGQGDPQLDVYLAEIYAGAITRQMIIDEVVAPIWVASSPVNRFTFRKGDNLNAGGPFPIITIAVRARDTLKNVSPPEVLTVENVKPGTITNPAINSTLFGLVLSWQWPKDPDCASLEIRASSDPLGLDPAPVTVGREAFPGTSHAIVIGSG